MEDVEDIQAIFGQCLCRFAVYIAAGGIGRAVGSVTADREDRRVQPGDPRNCGKCKLLIPSAQTLTGQVDDRLTTGDKGQLPVLSGMCPDDGSEEASGFPCLTAELIR